jgi:hypothetical protein
VILPSRASKIMFGFQQRIENLPRKFKIDKFEAK